MIVGRSVSSNNACAQWFLYNIYIMNVAKMKPDRFKPVYIHMFKQCRSMTVIEHLKPIPVVGIYK